MNQVPPFHYYGDVVRRLFITSGIIMLLGIPLFADNIPRPLSISILVAIVFALTAGLASPRNLWVAFLHLIVSAAAVAVFEYYTIATYIAVSSYGDLFLITSQVLAVIFFFALYYGAKTVRGMMIDGNRDGREYRKQVNTDDKEA